jgi:hypothetical protein
VNNEARIAKGDDCLIIKNGFNNTKQLASEDRKLKEYLLEMNQNFYKNLNIKQQKS